MSRSVRAGEVTGRLWQSRISAAVEAVGAVRGDAVPACPATRTAEDIDGRIVGPCTAEAPHERRGLVAEHGIRPHRQQCGGLPREGHLDRTPHRVDTLMPWPERPRRQHPLIDALADSRGQELRSRYKPTLKRGDSRDPLVAVSHDGQECPLAENRDEVRAIVVAMRAEPPEPRSVFRASGAIFPASAPGSASKKHATSIRPLLNGVFSGRPRSLTPGSIPRKPPTSPQLRRDFAKCRRPHQKPVRPITNLSNRCPTSSS